MSTGKTTLRPAHLSLVSRSLVVTAILVFFVFGIATYFSIAFQRKSKTEELEQYTHTVSGTLANSLGLPLWNFDYGQVQQQIHALKDAANFCGARVYNNQGNIVADTGVPAKLNSLQFLLQNGIYFNNPSQEGTPELIGKLELCVNHASLESELRDTMINQVFFFMLLAALLLGINYGTLMILIRPLEKFRTAISSIGKTLRPITDPDLLRAAEISSLVGSVNAMTYELSQSYEQLKMAKEQAEHSDRAKSDFLANMTHELRTPLNSIIGMTNLLLEHPLNNEEKEMLKVMQQSSSLLLALINDTLDLSKIEAGAVKLERISFDIEAVVWQVVAQLRYRARQKNLGINCLFEQKIPLLLGDPMRMGQIVMNLVNNAITHTQRGTVDIYISYAPLDHNRLELFGQIKDTGSGISKEKQPYLFKKFSQLKSSDARSFGGSGLGLAITRELVEMMGGTVGVESEESVGSTFWFKIPFTVSYTAHQQPTREELRQHTHAVLSPGEAKLLVVEDHPLNQALIRRLLAKYGFTQYDLVETGSQALNAIEEKSYDLILMDCFIPEISGYEATEIIREKEKGTNIHLPIVAITANAMIGEEEKCLAAGMDDYIAKPISNYDFINVLSQWIKFDPSILPGPEEISMQQSPLVTKPVNLDILKTFTGGDREIEKSMIQIFVSQSEKNLTTLKSACVSGLCQEWVEAAHALKGGAGSIGAEKLRELCASAQSMENAPAKDRSMILSQINAAYAEVTHYLQQEGWLDV